MVDADTFLLEYLDTHVLELELNRWGGCMAASRATPPYIAYGTLNIGRKLPSSQSSRRGAPDTLIKSLYWGLVFSLAFQFSPTILRLTQNNESEA